MDRAAPERKMFRQGTVFVTGGASGIGLARAGGSRGGMARRRRRSRPGPADAWRPRDAASLRAARRDRRGWGRTGDRPLRGRIRALDGARQFRGGRQRSSCLDASVSLFRKMVEVNLIGAFVACREAAHRMRERGVGSIVNIASGSGIPVNAGRVAYGASKGGVITMTKVMAGEVARLGIRVNAIAPGPIETPMVREVHTDQVRAEWMRTVPQRRYGTPDEIAGAATFSLDERRSSFITGQTICVDGGFTAAGIMGG